MFLRCLWDVCFNGDLIDISHRHPMPAEKGIRNLCRLEKENEKIKDRILSDIRNVLD